MVEVLNTKGIHILGWVVFTWAHYVTYTNVIGYKPPPFWSVVFCGFFNSKSFLGARNGMLNMAAAVSPPRKCIAFELTTWKMSPRVLSNTDLAFFGRSLKAAASSWSPMQTYTTELVKSIGNIRGRYLRHKLISNPTTSKKAAMLISSAAMETTKVRWVLNGYSFQLQR